ncbi:MAG: glycosyltransferase family 1 protein [Thermoplasmata archaeon]
MDVILLAQSWKTGQGHGTIVANFRTYLPQSLKERGLSVSVLTVEPSFNIKVGNRKMGGFISMWLYRFFKRPEGRILHALDAHVATQNTQLITLYDVVPLRFPKVYTSPMLKINWVYKGYMFRKARILLSISQFTKNEAVRLLGISPTKIKVIYPGINHQQYFVDKERTQFCKPDKITLVMTGNNDPRKNFSLAVKAAGILKEMGKDVSLVRFGLSEWEKETKKIRRTAKEWNVKVIEPGVVDVEVLRKTYSTCDVFVWPSIYEGMGLPPLEAMACGAKVVALDTEFNREFLGDVPVYVKNDPKEMAEGILEALKMDIGDKGIKQARKFTWERCAKEHVELYKQLLDWRESQVK